MKDRYLVEHEVGEGGAATVFLARDIKHGRNVAIKVFKPELAEMLGAERFSREIRTAANLANPHILTVLDSGTADGLLYYVMPFAEGESLRARITREGGLPIPDVIRILREVADALSTAHAAGVVHRDIKPDNVLLSGRHALVADFGVAKAVSASTGRNSITATGVTLGTPAYMAPEQAAADPHIDHRADIYALGVLGYEMLTGDPPFVRRSLQEVLVAHVTEPAPAVSSRRPSVPPALDALIAKCLVKQPGDRYQSAGDIVAELERIATPMAGTVATKAYTPSRGILAVTLALVLLIVGGWFAMSRLRHGGATNANIVVVFPFEFSGAPELAYLREGIVNVLETNLTGEGGPRAVASQTTIAQWRRKGGADHGLTEDEARGIARDLGAGQFVRGSIVAAGHDLVISASLVGTTLGGRSIPAQVKGPADSIASLATQLTGQLLSLRLGEAADRLHALQQVPPSALRQYLIGQQALRDSRFDESYNAFSTALAQDSSFALAALALNSAQSWGVLRAGPVNGIALAFRHREHLGPRDLVLLEMTAPTQFADHPMTMRELMDVRERLVQRVPDRPEAWFLIGDQYMHFGPAMGLTQEESFRRALFAFQKVLTLDPSISYVARHVVEIEMETGAPDRARRIADSLGVVLPHIDIAARVARGDSTDASHFRSEFEHLDADELMMVGFFTAGTVIADSAVATAIEHSTVAAQRVRFMRARRVVLTLEGRPNAARQASEQIEHLVRAPAEAGPQDVLYDVVFSSGDVPAGTAAMTTIGQTLRSSAEALAHPLYAERVPLFMAGLWASYREDTAGLSSTIRQLDAIGARKDSVYLSAAANLASEGLRLIAPSAGVDRVLLARFDSVMRDGPPYLGADMRSALNLIAARSWERLGDMHRAADAAERNAVIESSSVLNFSVAARERGRLKLAAGDTVGAVRTWSRYLRPRGSAEPSQRKLDDQIRAKLADIEHKKG